jgi:uncharacterized membrane protein YhaH (DUF805 family)
MTFVDAIKAGFKNYANFKGTASRSEFWYWVLFTTLLNLVLSQIDTLAGIGSTGMGLSSIASLALFIPNISVIFRRLHDAGFSGWLYAINLIPFAAAAWLAVTFVSEYEASGLPMDPQEIGLAIEEFAITQTGPIYDAIVAGAFSGSASAFFTLLFTGIAVVVASIFFYTRPTKTAEQGNKYAGDATVPQLYDGGTTS